jgi:hypothetical protein
MKKVLIVIKNFVWSMLAEKGEISSKRCIATSGMINIIYLSIYSQHTGKPIDHVVFGMLVSVVLGAAGITAYEKVAGFVKGLPPVPEQPQGNETAIAS